QFIPLTFDETVPNTGHVTVTPTTGLDASGDTVTVTGSGYPEGVGVYVRLCKAPTGIPGTEAGRTAACDGQGVWANATVPGPGTTPMTGGAFSTTLPVVGAFASPDVVNCMQPGSCGVFVRRDHSGAADYSYDEFFPLTFDPTTTPPDVEPEEPTLNDVTLTLSKSADVADGEVITASGANYTPEQGVYVQWCAKPTGQLGTAAGRTNRCYPGQDGIHTVWQTPIPADGTFAVQITAEKSFTTEGGEDIDCTEPGSCGVFTRRDHNGGSSDYSQDAFAAVTFGDGKAPEAEKASIEANRTTDLDPAGDDITVSGANFRPGTDYVVALCADGDETRCDFDNAEQVTSGADAAAAAATRAPGGTAAAEAGAFEVKLHVVGNFDDTVCGADGCEVRTWAVSLSEAADEVTLPVSFAATSDTGGATDGTGTGAGSASGELPRTGSNSAPLVLIGFGLLGLGAALAAGSRRRRTA
ncbi:MAG: LPXTG cell wall anchor domain-containing protein, partial [Acidimicrobiales bacterium]|nr:LPXTG cell wall anchor domain-containing protein [Acidimicrobiales bacterium]